MNVSLHDKKDYVKKIEKGDVVTRFYCNLKNLHPNVVWQC
jgi:hypothetical protein